MPPLAPVAVFVHRRPEHVRQLLASLEANPEAAASEIVVFADGARSEAERADVEAARSAVRAAALPSLRLVEREHNLGLAGSVIAGVSELVERHGRVIVLEDDLVVAPTFLRFMNDALARFRDEERVMSVSGYMFPVELPRPVESLFLPFPSSWGWATWHRAWRQLEPTDALTAALGRSRTLRRRFDLDGAAPFSAMLEDLRAGRVDSWAIRWRATVFLAGGLSLYPARSLVGNAGFDGSGVHCGARRPLIASATAAGGPVATFPAALEVDEAAYREVRRLYLRDTPAWRRLARSTRDSLRRLRPAAGRGES